MNSIQAYRLPKTFFVPLDDAQMFEARRQLAKQLFQLAYFGKISPEYASFLEIEERNYMYNLLIEQLDEEKKRNEEEVSKAKKASRSSGSRRR